MPLIRKALNQKLLKKKVREEARYRRVRTTIVRLINLPDERALPHRVIKKEKMRSKMTHSRMIVNLNS